MTPEILKVLRQDFPPAVVGKLPRVTCAACSKKQCQKHQAARCQVCKGWLTTAHTHLDYVGHADITDRLLTADPEWNWAPLSWTEDGLPRITKGLSGELTLWINLTVAGVTRLGVGSVAAGAFDAEKQLIGDALRNAAMRFGAGLKLWAKSDLESSLSEAEHNTGPSTETPPARKATAKKATAPARQAAAPPPEVDPETGEVRTTRRRPPPVPANGSAASAATPAPAGDSLGELWARIQAADRALIPRDRTEVRQAMYAAGIPSPKNADGSLSADFTVDHALNLLSILARYHRSAAEAG